MAISNETLRVDYDCDGAVTEFPITIAYINDEDLKVVHYDDDAGEEYTLTLNTQYTISGGNVVTTLTYPAGDRIAISRDMALTQPIDLQAGDDMDPEAIETGLDRLTLMAQQVVNATKRSVKLAETDPDADLILPQKTARQNSYLHFDENGDPEAHIGPVPRMYDPFYTFSQNDVIQYQGSFWKSMIDDNTGTTPGTDNTIWEPQPFDIAYSADRTYNTGDIIVYDSIIYESLTDTNKGNVPEAGSPHWTEAAVMTNADTVDSHHVGLEEGDIPTNDYVDFVIASSPEHYSRTGRWLVKSPTDRTTLVSPHKVLSNINDVGYRIIAQAEIDLDTATEWDNTLYQTPAERAGKDFYIYACMPASGRSFDIVLSANSTYPTGYTASNSRKIGGFHCLCADIGTDTYSYVNSVDDLALVDEAYISHTITGTKHWLEGYVAGDILPFSIWDLIHRPVSNPEGMVYSPGTDIWVDIYLASWDGTRLVSENGGTTADGTSTEKFHQYKFSQHFGRQKKMLPRQDDFVSFSLGSPQGVNITGSADPGTTGEGHTATNGLRIVSLIGVEDATGGLWQWGREAGATNDVGSAYFNAYDGNDANVGGQHYEAPNRPLELGQQCEMQFTQVELE